MNKDHQFIWMEQVRRSPEGANKVAASWQDEYGARVGCPFCGEVRTIWPDGKVVVEVNGTDVHSGDTRA